MGVVAAVTGVALAVPAPAAADPASGEAVSGDIATGGAATGAGFEAVAIPGLPPGAALNAVASAADGQAWMVGEVQTGVATDSDPPAVGVIEHWDGHRWHAEAMPALPPIDDQEITAVGLTSVTVGHDGRVFAAGWQRGEKIRRRPLALQRTPAGWQQLPLLPELSNVVTYQLTGVSAWDARHVWFIGTSTYHKVHADTAFWDGTGWTQPAYPVSQRMEWPTGIAAVGPADAWLVGSNWLPVNGRGGHAARWNGTGWTPVDLPATGTTPTGTLQSVDGVAATGRDVWLWGVADDVQVILRWDGHAWVPGPPPPEQPAGWRIESLDPTGRGRALAAGTYPADGTPEGRAVAAVLAWNGHRWAELRLPDAVTAAQTVRTAVAAGRPGWVVIDTVPAGSTDGPVTATVLRVRRR